MKGQISLEDLEIWQGANSANQGTLTNTIDQASQEVHTGQKTHTGLENQVSRTGKTSAVQMEKVYSEYETGLRSQPEDSDAKFEDLFYRLSRSNFRSRFHLKPADLQYIQDKGMETIRSHARDFVSKRLAPAVIPNDGKQTPMRGHPVFIAQHATGCCCRGCLYKWHRIPAGTELTKKQQEYVVDVLMEWIRRQLVWL